MLMSLSAMARLFDALGDDGQAKRPAQPDGRADNRGGVGIGEQLEQERPVDLEFVRRRDHLRAARAAPLRPMETATPCLRRRRRKAYRKACRSSLPTNSRRSPPLRDSRP